MDLLLFLYAVSLLFFASLGTGHSIMLLVRRQLPPLSVWLYTTVAYFLGQGVLGSAFILLGLNGLFTPGIVLAILLAFSGASFFFILESRQQWRDCIQRALRFWLSASLAWKVLSLIFLALLGYGFGTMGGDVEGDASAFYLAVSKVISSSHAIIPLRGYESFSTVGYLAETLLAALYSLGLPDASPRGYSFINFLPTLVVFYGLARECRLSRRGAVLVVIMITTSSAGAVLWGTGKTDLFAVGPAVAAYLFAIIAWKNNNAVTLLMTGVFTGFACVFKLSYIVPLVPSIAVLGNWSLIINGFQSLLRKDWRKLILSIFSSSKNMLILFIAFICAFAPHMLKNAIFNGSIIGIQGAGSYYTTHTIIRLVLSYPFALTFGNYWAQFGTLSPLILAFAPLVVYLPRPDSWRESKLAAVGVATLIGLSFWIILFPSYFMPRYFLATLFILAIPVSAGTDIAGRKGTVLAKTILIAIAVTLITTPAFTNTRYHTFTKRTFSRLFNTGKESFLYTRDFDYALAHKAINAHAGKGDRILLLSYYRLWLRSDLLEAVSMSPELKLVADPETDFWELIKKRKFRFILWDKNFIKLDPKLFESQPKDIQLQEIYHDKSMIAFEILRK